MLWSTFSIEFPAQVIVVINLAQTERTSQVGAGASFGFTFEVPPPRLFWKSEVKYCETSLPSLSTNLIEDLYSIVLVAPLISS